jgi:L-alanine-DL-glutamate epimerase-like enolase superfamily enzyme
MKVNLRTYDLIFENPFKLAHGVRNGTKALFLSLEKNGETGYAEATFPPYLLETVELTKEALLKIEFSSFILPNKNIALVLLPLEKYDLSAFTRAVASNCILDLNAKLLNVGMIDLMGNQNSNPNYFSNITVTKNDLPSIKQKKKSAEHFSHLKLKLDGNNDLDFVKNVLAEINKPFCVDANQGWEDMEYKQVIYNATELKKIGCELIEQPFLKSNYTKHKQLLEEEILPVYADESIQNRIDLEKHHDAFTGVNIKVLKCGGIDRAFEIAKRAKELQKKIIIGCMSESSCGCATAYTLHSFADYMDIDGPWLINNNPFTGFSIHNGKFTSQFKKGIGVVPTNNMFLHTS